jgi:hypothetical protein
LLFHQDFIESADGLVKFFTKPGRTFVSAFSRKFTDTASATGTRYRALRNTGTTGTTAALGTTSLAASATSTAGSLIFGLCRRSRATKAFACLAHAAYAAGQGARIAAVTSRFAVTLCVAIGIALIATGDLGFSATGTATGLTRRRRDSFRTSAAWNTTNFASAALRATGTAARTFRAARFSARLTARLAA